MDLKDELGLLPQATSRICAPRRINFTPLFHIFKIKLITQTKKLIILGRRALWANHAFLALMWYIMMCQSPTSSLCDQLKGLKKKVFKEQNVHAPKLKLREIPLPYPCLKEVQKHFNPKAQTPILLIKNFLNMKARFKITSIFFQVAFKKHRVQLIGKILNFYHSFKFKQGAQN